MKTPITPSVALVSELLLIRTDGTETMLTIRIGLPSRRGDDWACPCEIAGLDPQYADIFGVDALQALCLALKLVRLRLTSVIEAGNTICLPADREHPLSTSSVKVLFGVDSP